MARLLITMSWVGKEKTDEGLQKVAIDELRRLFPTMEHAGSCGDPSGDATYAEERVSEFPVEEDPSMKSKGIPDHPTRCPRCMRETLLTNPTTGQQLCVKKHSCGYEWHPEED